MGKEDLKVTDEYTEVLVDGEKLKIFNSLKNERLNDETYKEYVLRRKAIKNYEASKARGEFKHKSASLIPKIGLKFNEETKKVEEDIILDPSGKPIWIGKTAGKTYIKNNKKEEHLELVETMKTLKENGKQ